MKASKSQYKTKTAVLETSARMQNRGYTVRSWAEANGFNYQTVRNMLSGQYRNRNTVICQQIRCALVRDGIVEVGI